MHYCRTFSFRWLMSSIAMLCLSCNCTKESKTNKNWLTLLNVLPWMTKKLKSQINQLDTSLNLKDIWELSMLVGINMASDSGSSKTSTFRPGEKLDPRIFSSTTSSSSSYRSSWKNVYTGDHVIWKPPNDHKHTQQCVNNTPTGHRKFCNQ